jgi:hypothetical protein
VNLILRLSSELQTLPYNKDFYSLLRVMIREGERRVTGWESHKLR